MRKAPLTAALLLAGCITVQAPPPQRCPPCQDDVPGTQRREPAPKLPRQPDVLTTGSQR